MLSVSLLPYHSYVSVSLVHLLLASLPPCPRIPPSSHSSYIRLLYDPQFPYTSPLVAYVSVLITGTIVMATGTEVSGFAGGAVLYQFGFTGVQRMPHLHTSSL